MNGYRVLGRFVALVTLALTVFRAILEASGWIRLQESRARAALIGRRRGAPAAIPTPPTEHGSVGVWLPIAFAAGAVALYAIGSVRTAGQIRAAGMPISDTFGLVPLEDHITNGLGVLLADGPLMFVLVGMIALRIYSEHVSSDERARRARNRPKWRLWLSFWPQVFVTLLLLVVGPWWSVPLLLLVWGGEACGLVLSQRGRPALQARPVLTRFGVFAVTFLVVAFASGYWLADPLPTVRLEATSAKVTTGVLLARSGGSFVLLEEPRGGKAVYTAWPQDHVRSARIANRRRAADRSLLQLAGVDIGIPRETGER